MPFPPLEILIIFWLAIAENTHKHGTIGQVDPVDGAAIS